MLKDPIITLEINERGESNFVQFKDHAVYRFQKFMRKKRKFIHWIVRYELEKFSIRRGTIQYIDARQAERDWAVGSVSFSLARVVYPPDPFEALPAAIYGSAVVQGAEEGKLVFIGRFNPFSKKKSFNVTGSAKGIVLSEYNYFVHNFPLNFAEGTVDFKVKALCHEDQVDIRNTIKVQHLGFSLKEVDAVERPLAFGLPPELVVTYFDELWPQDEPLEFSFDVVGNLRDPNFSMQAGPGPSRLARSRRLA